MAAPIQLKDLVADTETRITLRYREPYVTEGINKKLAVVLPHGVYRGWRLGTAASPLRVAVVPDPETDDQVLSQRSTLGDALTLRLNGQIELDLNQPSFLSQTVVIGVFAYFSLASETTAEIRGYLESDWNALSLADQNEIVVLGTVAVPGSGVIAATSITHDRRAEAWSKTASAAVPWASLLQNGSFEWGPAGDTGNQKFLPWENTQNGNGEWTVETTDPFSGGQHLECTNNGGGGFTGVVSQPIDTPVNAAEYVRLSFRIKVVLADTGSGTFSAIVRFRDAAGASTDATVPVTITAVDAAYRLIEKTIQIPVGASQVGELRFSASSINGGSAGVLLRVDDVRLHMETMDALTAHPEHSGKGPVVTSKIYLTEPSSGASSNVVRVKVDPAGGATGGGEVIVERADGDTVTLQQPTLLSRGPIVSPFGVTLTGTGTIDLTGPATSTTAIHGTGGPPNGIGVHGTGDGTGYGVLGKGDGVTTPPAQAGQGVVGVGASTGGSGVQGLGLLSGHGVVGTSGATSGAAGGSFTSVAATTGSGVEGTGSLIGTGVKGTGGASGGTGVQGTGGGTNSVGVSGAGKGQGSGGEFAAASPVLPLAPYFQAGAIGFGGGTDGPGLMGFGKGAAPGVYGEAQTTGTAFGGEFVGHGTGAGVSGVGGTSAAAAVIGTALNTAGAGAKGIGGTASGIGVDGAGGGTGTGVRGTGGTSSGIGVLGTGGSSNGIGTKGEGTGTGFGVLGIGAGGSATAPTQAKQGVVGVGGLNGRGVEGKGDGTGPGGWFQGGPTDGTGIITTGQGNGGGLDSSSSGTGSAIAATAAGSGDGVTAIANSGYGVSGSSNSASKAGVRGVGTGAGVPGGSFTGGSTSGIGVVAAGTGTGHGVTGTAGGGAASDGVVGTSTASFGVSGSSSGLAGVSGVGTASGVTGGTFTGGSSGGRGLTATGGSGGQGASITGGAGATGLEVLGPSGFGVKARSQDSFGLWAVTDTPDATPAIKSDGWVDLGGGTNPAATTGFTNVLTKKNICKAWAVITFDNVQTTNIPFLSAGFNVTGVTGPGGPGGTKYTLSFANAIGLGVHGGNANNISFSIPNCTLTATSGAFLPTDVGREIVIAGATGNNSGTFLVTQYISASQIVYTNNASPGSVGGSFTWTFSSSPNYAPQLTLYDYALGLPLVPLVYSVTDTALMFSIFRMNSTAPPNSVSGVEVTTNLAIAANGPGLKVIVNVFGVQ